MVDDNDALYDSDGDSLGNDKKKRPVHSGDTEIEITRSVTRFAICASFNACTIGYDQGSAIHIGKLLQSALGLNDLERSLFMAILFAFMPIGAMGSPTISDRVGRRAALVCSAFVWLVGTLLTTFAQSFYVILGGRAVAGIGAGLGFAVEAMYIAEISPATRRGELVTWSTMGASFGLVFGVSTGLILSSVQEKIRWRVMLGIGMIFPVLVIITSIKVLKESPRFLLLANRSREARMVLSLTYPKGSDVGAVLDSIRESLNRDERAENSTGWATIRKPTPAFRYMLRVGWGLSFASQAVGFDAIIYYILDLMTDSGVENGAMQGAFLVGLLIIKLQCNAISARLLDTFGRRIMLFISLLGVTASLVLIGVSFYLTEIYQPLVAMIGMGLYVASYGIGLGPASQLIPVEVFATSIRAKALSISVIINRGTAAVMSATLLILSKALSWPAVFFSLAVMSGLVWILVLLYLPETKGRSLEDMPLHFGKFANDPSIMEAEKNTAEGSNGTRMLKI